MNVNIGSASSEYTQREIDLIGSDSNCEVETKRYISVHEELLKDLGSSDSDPDVVQKTAKALGRPRLTEEEKAANKAGRNEEKIEKLRRKIFKK